MNIRSEHSSDYVIRYSFFELITVLYKKKTSTILMFVCIGITGT